MSTLGGHHILHSFSRDVIHHSILLLHINTQYIMNYQK